MMFGTHHDAPVAFPDSMRVLDATVTRRSRSGDIIGPDQRVDVMTALKAMTIWPAWQHFEEADKGSIEVGKLADFVILSDDPTVDRSRRSRHDPGPRDDQRGRRDLSGGVSPAASSRCATGAITGRAREKHRRVRGARLQADFAQPIYPAIPAERIGAMPDMGCGSGAVFGPGPPNRRLKG